MRSSRVLLGFSRTAIRVSIPIALEILLDIALIKQARNEAVDIGSVELVYLRGTDAWKKHTKLRAV